MDRYTDLLKQGFMRSALSYKQPKPKQERKIVACDKCNDWHWQGRHTKKATA